MIRAETEGQRGHKVWAVGWLVAVLVTTALMLTAKPAHADTFTVTNAADPGDGFCNAQGCTLREAIEVANARSGADTIKFNIPGAGVKTIAPTSNLPAISEAAVIDGYSQPGSRPNTRATGAIDAVILIEISGVNISSGGEGLRISASNVMVRGLAINRFTANGIDIGSATSTRIVGNFIGTDASGTLDRGNGDGVDIESGSKHTIGGTAPASRNLISGNDFDGVKIDTGNSRVQGNLIGVKKDATSPLGNSRASIEVFSGKDSIIGGTEPGAGNVIANSSGAGIIVFGVESRILSNSVFSNGGLGIDLANDGRSLNDPRDTDAGANNLQNFPELASAVRFSGGTTVIEGTLESTPSTRKKKRSFTIQFFANPQNDDEGKTFLGQKKVTTNRQGLVSFAFETSRPLALGDGITATATAPGGDTSEFSDPVRVSLTGSG